MKLDFKQKRYLTKSDLTQSICEIFLIIMKQFKIKQVKACKRISRLAKTPIRNWLRFLFEIRVSFFELHRREGGF